MIRIDRNKYIERLKNTMIYKEAGKITKSIGLIYEAYLPGASVGSICRIITTNEEDSVSGVDAEVIGFKDRKVILMPYEITSGINNESLVVLRSRRSTVNVGSELLGRVIDGLGKPIDGKGAIRLNFKFTEERTLYHKPTMPMERELISEPLDLGVRSINALLTCGKGQRVGIMAGSGVGKSVLLGMIAKNTKADVNIIALVGERGREVREFIERELGPEGLAKSVLIVATSDTSPLMRMRAAFLAATISEYFRDREKDVLFMMDSVTRFCMAQREIGLSLGEPPATKGYTPSVFATLPKLLERFGTRNGKGSVTALMTVLVEGDDVDDPIADSSRSILDGHLVLSREFAQKGHYPAIDVLQSSSRVMQSVIDSSHREWAIRVREWIALYRQVEDLINLGAYVPGTDQKIDQAISLNGRIQGFLRQNVNELVDFDSSLAQLHSIIRAGEAFVAGKKVQEENTKSQGRQDQITSF